MTDLIFVSMENWDEVWRRNQFLCAGLARRFPEMKILFVTPPRDYSHSLRMGRVVDMCRNAEWSVPDYPGITVTSPPKLFPNTLRLGRAMNESLYRSYVRHTARRMGLTRPILWLNPHYAVHMVGRMDERSVVYDITDDWISFGQKAWLTDLIRRQDEELCHRADAVIVCSQKLYQMKQSLAQRLFLIPNGVDTVHYSHVLDSDGPLPPEAAAWRHPVLGYTGTVHPDRVDVDLLEQVAHAFPCGMVALVGPMLLPEAEQARLRAAGNVVMMGSVPYSRVPDYMRAFDVCITPHRMTDFTESLNPIKLWEYLAAGKPVVSTDVAGFREYPDLVKIVRDAEGFVEAVGAALEEDVALAAMRQGVAAAHSWEARLDEVVKVLETCVQDGEGGFCG